ncbi:phosphoenolpyruvate--protein phosphotransferase [Clostridiales bacterium F-3ap]|uniref:Phosphoenolpyruvate-protein phosphotransferase n=1 Tax=Anaerotalea alkaliphila TaxID=2662126 RepID=A0A7X5HXU3_9FIRM|nr:phosphoenolpyruvate--protein phosphotransferase [Anaerotalea alkaliphila]
MSGAAASKGIGFGKAFVLENKPLEIIERNIDDKDEELRRVEEAVRRAVEQLEELRETTRNTIGEEEAEIFEAHKWMLLDPEWTAGIRQRIITDGKCAEVATEQTTAAFVEMLAALEDPYLQARALDLRDVSERVLRILLHIETIDLSRLKGPVILVAEDLHPSDVAALDPAVIDGMVTRQGSETSHSAIIARSLGIPAVMGVVKLSGAVECNDRIIVDGDKGELFINPAVDTQEDYLLKRKKKAAFKESLQVFRGKKTQTFDEEEVELVCNIGRAEEAENVTLQDGEGIGLFRSEFIYFDRKDAPEEQEQYRIYAKVLESMEGKPVIIRTLDAGGDKDIPYLNLPQEMNPFLGQRAIRVCLDRKDLFKTQLRAILRASVHGNAKIMFPMISTVTELSSAKEVLQEAREELKAEGAAFNPEVEVGIMMEVPSAAIIADQLAKHVDFFSIGTNDLVQYTMATDRMNPAVKGLYKPHQPAVVRLINQVIQAGHQAGIWVGMCGEAASNPMMIPLLVGMGLDEYSVSPSCVLETRWLISKIDRKKAKKLLPQVLELEGAEEIEESVRQFLKENGIDGKENSDFV